MMKEYFDQLVKKFDPDIKIRDAALSHVGKILSATQTDRLAYLINRGMTYNNPHIGLNYVAEKGIKIDMKDPKNSLRKLISEHG